MHRASASIAIFALLVFAGVGYARGLSCLTCALRALAAAAILYIVLTVAGRVVLRAMVTDLMDKAGSDKEPEGTRR
jgi:hypothetical protein